MRDDNEEIGGNFLSHVPGIIWQRRWWLIIPAVLLTIAGIAASFLLPTTYRSQAVLLVQSAQLPEDVAGDGAAEIIDRRIARIRQQVLSRPDLIELINKHALYNSERASKPLSEIIEDMRDAVSISAMEGSATPGAANQSATIAFSLNFDYSDPVKAQAVAQDLVEQVLLLDSTGNAEQATSTVTFLTDQAAGLETQIKALETQIAGINAANGSVLTNSGVTILGGSGGNYDVQIAALQRENSQLNSQRSATRTSADRDPMVASAESQLAALRAVYSENHPDIAIARQRLEEARALAAQNVKKLPIDTIDQQIAFNNSQIAALNAARATERSQVSQTLGSQQRAPLVQQEIAQLQQRLSLLNDQYQAVSTRLLGAQAGAKAEDQQMGERLSVIDPPVVPDDPVSPNRLLLSLGGLVAGLGLGLVLVFGTEMILRPIRDPATLAGMLGEAPMVVIPVIKSKFAKKKPGRFGRWPLKLWPFKRRGLQTA